jgi:hypothetical protein
LVIADRFAIGSTADIRRCVFRGARCSAGDILLLCGEAMTSERHGHAVVRRLQS